MAGALLSGDAVDRIVDTCRTGAGDRLRSITYFRRDDYEQLYLRDDLEQDADLATFVGLEWRESGITEDAYRGTELGEHVYTLRRFDDGYLLRLAADRDGVFVTLDDLSMAGCEDLATSLGSVVDSLRDPA